MESTAEQIQEKIFQRMTADQKMALGAQLWLLGKALAEGKQSYGRERPEKTSPADRRNS